MITEAPGEPTIRDTGIVGIILEAAFPGLSHGRSEGSQKSLCLDHEKFLKISPFSQSRTAFIHAFKTTFKNSFTHLEHLLHTCCL